MAKFERHVFVCTNERESGNAKGCCKSKDAEAVLEAFKKKLVEAGFKRVVRANKSGCLDQCAHGAVVVVYPDAVWYGRVTPADVDEIVDSHIRRGVPVKRLEIPADQLTGLQR